MKRDRGNPGLRERAVEITGERGDILEAVSLYILGRDVIEGGLKPKQFKRFLAEAARELWPEEEMCQPDPT